MNFICIDFINSAWYSSHREYGEALANPEWIASFTEKWMMETIDMPNSKELVELIRLRELLADALASLKADGKLSPQVIGTLNHYLFSGIYSRRIVNTEDGYMLEKVPVNQGWAWVKSEIAESFIDLISNHEIERIRYCENPQCGWIFYDKTKNRSGRWCDDSCRNLMKVRRFRERKRKDKLADTEI